MSLGISQAIKFASLQCEDKVNFFTSLRHVEKFLADPKNKRKSNTIVSS